MKKENIYIPWGPIIICLLVLGGIGFYYIIEHDLELEHKVVEGVIIEVNPLKYNNGFAAIDHLELVFDTGEIYIIELVDSEDYEMDFTVNSKFIFEFSRSNSMDNNVWHINKLYRVPDEKLEEG